MHVVGRALDAAVLAGDQKLRIQGRLTGRLARSMSQLLPTPPAEARMIGCRFQDGLDRRNHLALRIGAVLCDGGEFGGGLRDLLGAGVFERAGALEHQGRHQDHRQQREPGADPENLLEFRSFAVETDV